MIINSIKLKFNVCCAVRVSKCHSLSPSTKKTLASYNLILKSVTSAPIIYMISDTIIET